MTLASVLLFALTELALSLSPGPAVFLVVSQGMKAGFRGSLRGILGVMTGELIFFVLSCRRWALAHSSSLRRQFLQQLSGSGHSTSFIWGSS